MNRAAAASLPPAAAAPWPWARWGLRAVVIAYLGLMIAVPLAAVVERGFASGIGAFWAELASPLARDALQRTLAAAMVVTVVNAVMGTLTAYVLVRYEFPGRRWLDGLVDLPFAIPTLVTGVMLVMLYGPQGILGRWLEARGTPIIFAPPGIVLALLFVCFPFVVRAVQPVLIGVERSHEEAAFTLGASRWTVFRRVTLPSIAPAVVTGTLLCFARALGEFGSIVVVAGNVPGRSLTAPVYIYGQIESENPRGASAVSVVLLALSLILLLASDWIQRRRRIADA